MVVYRVKSSNVAKALLEKLKGLLPCQQIKLLPQESIGSSINISTIRMDLLAKCYGGDISRKKKLLNKLEKEMNRMKVMGKVDVSQESFMAVLKLNEAK